RASQVTYDARFVREGGRWLYAGVAWDELAGEHLLLKYQAGSTAFGPQRILDLAEEAYAQVTADLDAPLPLPQEIKIYDEAELFRASISPSLPDVSSWTESGEAIKLWLQDERLIQTAIASELTRQALLAQGLQTDWLHEGIAAFEAGRATSLGAHWAAGIHMPTVQEAIRRHNEFPLYDMPAWEGVPDDQADLFRAQSWSLISFIFERHGLAGLRRFVAQSLTSDDAAANLRAALRVTPETFEAEWREHARIAGVPGDLVSLARRFDPERALAHVTVLASPELGGRQAGSPEADLAADYIAEQFTALGLEPLGDPLTGTQRSYLQQFPISYTHVVSVPTLALLKADGTLLHEFTYRQDFLESTGQGNARGELVWIRPGHLEGMYFGGAVVLEQDISVERAQQLEEHGAGGVVIVTDKEPDDLQASYVRPASAPELSIPVFEITGAAFETLLGELGLERGELVSSPPALPLGVLARQTLARSPVTTTLTTNVLGLLPGRDPEYSDEVILVGAHYDHIGQLPDGFYFPGANQNGSGVAAMLEMARVWQSAGYHPGRSVLFAAWGAEEVDGAGVVRYLADPAVPVTQTVGVIALDTIAGGGGAKLMFHGTREHDLALIHRFEAGYAELDRRAWRQGSTGEGWHVPFNAAGIPTSKLIWDEAEEDFYLPTDTADRIDSDWLASSGEILTLVVSWLAGQ
ncbi:MAG: M28 family peptidase, partial [Chloroflexi bacterium]|nr:M28 family peptidase [Chloroflexota bacterium]